MDSRGHCDPEKGTEGAQVYSLLGKGPRLEHSAHSPWDDTGSQPGTHLSATQRTLQREGEPLGAAWNNSAVAGGKRPPPLP